MLKKITLLSLLFTSFFISTDVSAASIVGEWKGTLNVRARTWNGDRKLIRDERKKFTIDWMFYPNKEFVHIQQPGYEHGFWQKSGNSFKLLPDFNGPPSLINGLYNEIFVTKWQITGKQRGNKITGKYHMKTTVAITVPFGVGSVNYNELKGTFTARRVNTIDPAL